MPDTDLPAGPFDVIVADPPWMYQKAPGTKGAGLGADGIAELQYPTMTNEQIAALPVRQVAADNAHLFLWCTNPGLWGNRFSTVTPHDIAAAWGFQYKTLITWVKTTADGDPSGGGMGWFFRGCTEHVIYATRGRAGIPAELREPNVIMAPRLRHSEKPPEFMWMVERVTTGRRLEMFARTRRKGWEAWGNQTNGEQVRERPADTLATLFPLGGGAA
jgi:N6-adenosine-specific RNA methylase IME4